MKSFRITLLFTFLCCCLSAAAQESVNIWAGTDCKAKVKMTPYLAEGDERPAVIVCPGGSYFWLDRGSETVSRLSFWSIVLPVSRLSLPTPGCYGGETVIPICCLTFSVP